MVHKEAIKVEQIWTKEWIPKCSLPLQDLDHQRRQTETIENFLKGRSIQK